MLLGARRGVCVEYAEITLELRVRVKYAKSMRDLFGGKYPILQGEITFVC